MFISTTLHWFQLACTSRQGRSRSEVDLDPKSSSFGSRTFFFFFFFFSCLDSNFLQFEFILIQHNTFLNLALSIQWARHKALAWGQLRPGPKLPDLDARIHRRDGSRVWIWLFARRLDCQQTSTDTSEKSWSVCHFILRNSVTYLLIWSQDNFIDHNYQKRWGCVESSRRYSLK